MSEKRTLTAVVLALGAVFAVVASVAVVTFKGKLSEMAEGARGAKAEQIQVLGREIVAAKAEIERLNAEYASCSESMGQMNGELEGMRSDLASVQAAFDAGIMDAERSLSIAKKQKRATEVALRKATSMVTKLAEQTAVLQAEHEERMQREAARRAGLAEDL